MTPMLIRGARGDNVRRLQEVLAVAGLYDRRIDGQFGHFTEQAVMDLQRATGTRVDGWYGPRTIDGTAELFARVNSAKALAVGKPAVVPYLGS